MKNVCINININTNTNINIILKNIKLIYKKFINKILTLLKYFNEKECFGYKYMMSMVK